VKKISEMNTFRAFRSFNYTLYFTGRSISQFGTWMQRTAVIWVVYTITHSAFLIGITIFAEQIPSFLFSFIGGAAADRYNKYRIIKITQIASMIQSVLLAALVLTNHTMVWAILALSVLLGIINAFDVPARQSLIHEVVADQEDLPNAVSLTTAMAGLAQLLAPALSGIILKEWGAAACFFVNAASFAGVYISMLLMTHPPYVPKNTKKKVITEFVEGFAYLKKAPGIGMMILMVSIVSLLVLPYNTVLPVFAKVVFKGDASTFGYITSFVGVGGVIGTVFLASRKPNTNLKRILLVSTIIMSLGMIGFSRVHNFPVAMFFAVLMGYGGMAQWTVCNIVVQSESAPEMRGRAIGILLMAIFGMLPVGSVITGAVSQYIGAPATVLAEGVISLAIAATFARFLVGKGKERNLGDNLEIAETEDTIVER
jgi:MFS family permease